MKERARERAQRSFVRCTPAEDWELWTFSNTKRPQFVRRIKRPAAAPGRVIVGLPVRQTVTIATWVATDDRALVPKIVELQLEQQGLIQRDGKRSAPDIRVLETQADKSLALDRKSTRLNSSHPSISYAVFCLQKKKQHSPISHNHKKNTTTKKKKRRKYKL